MARSFDNILMGFVSGQIGKQIVIKKNGKKTVITIYPEKNIEPACCAFAEACATAKALAYAVSGARSAGKHGTRNIESRSERWV